MIVWETESIKIYFLGYEPSWSEEAFVIKKVKDAKPADLKKAEDVFTSIKVI